MTIARHIRNFPINKRLCLAWLVLPFPGGVAVAADTVTAPFPGVGITRIHRSLTSPKVVNVEILVLDLNDPRIELFVTPRDPTFRADYGLARTTTFVSQWGLDGATNANFWSGGLGSEGDARTVIGLALSDGWTVHLPTPAPTPPDPALIVREDGSAMCGYVRSFNSSTYPRDRQGVSSVGYDGATQLTGTLLVTNGVNTGLTTTPRPTTSDPRTVAGVSQDGRTLVLAAIDGRTTCSAGMTAVEAADLLLEFGVWNGINLDGGGSTTMVLRYPGQPPGVINCTTDPNYERPVANHIGFRVIPAYESLTLVAAFAFGATDHTGTVHNDPSITYTKLRQDAGSTASLQYDASRGYGYTDLAGLATPPSDNSGRLDGDQLYAENIGVNGLAGGLTFRVDVPNGKYRFVAAGGDAARNDHISNIRVRNGGGTWVNMVHHEHVYNPTLRPEFWRVGFADKTPPPADGSGHDSGTFVDPAFRPQINSPVIEVTSGYLEVRQIAVARAGSGTPVGGDLCLLEVWRLNAGTPTIDVTPLSIAFPNLRKGLTSPASTITVRNTGTDTLEYSATLDGPDASQFEIVGDAAATIAPGQQDGLSVRFRPTRKGSATAELRIASNAPADPTKIVSLTGFALADPPPDMDEDGDVDLADFGRFQMCFNGPNRPLGGLGCEEADYDSDGDVDLADFTGFQACFNGPNAPPGPACAG